MVSILRSLDRSVRNALRPLLTHTYTRTSTVAVDPPETDAWGNAATEDGTPVSGLPCVFLWQDRLVADDRGRMTVSTPTLYVPYDDALAAGDRVTNVTDRDGTVLLLAATVESIDPAAEAGASTIKIVRLTGARAVK